MDRRRTIQVEEVPNIFNLPVSPNYPHFSTPNHNQPYLLDLSQSNERSKLKGFQLSPTQISRLDQQIFRDGEYLSIEEIINSANQETHVGWLIRELSPLFQDGDMTQFWMDCAQTAYPNAYVDDYARLYELKELVARRLKRQDLVLTDVLATGIERYLRQTVSAIRGTQAHMQEVLIMLTQQQERLSSDVIQSCLPSTPPEVQSFILQGFDAEGLRLCKRPEQQVACAQRVLNAWRENHQFSNGSLLPASAVKYLWNNLDTIGYVSNCAQSWNYGPTKAFNRELLGMGYSRLYEARAIFNYTINNGEEEFALQSSMVFDLLAFAKFRPGGPVNINYGHRVVACDHKNIPQVNPLQALLYLYGANKLHETCSTKWIQDGAGKVAMILPKKPKANGNYLFAQPEVSDFSTPPIDKAGFYYTPLTAEYPIQTAHSGKDFDPVMAHHRIFTVAQFMYYYTDLGRRLLAQQGDDGYAKPEFIYHPDFWDNWISEPTLIEV